MVQEVQLWIQESYFPPHYLDMNVLLFCALEKEHLEFGRLQKKLILQMKEKGLIASEMVRFYRFSVPL